MLNGSPETAPVAGGAGLAALHAPSRPAAGEAFGGMPRRRPAWWRAAGAAAVCLIAAAAVLAPLLPLPDPNRTSPSRRLAAPLAPGYALGSDHLGRDLLSRVVWGARVSLTVGGLAALLAMAAGTAIGLATGFYGGVTDQVVMRGVDVIMAFPYILLAMVLVAALGPGLVNAMIAVAVVNVSFYARGVRAAVLLLREQDFVEAARAMGASEARILRTYILPGIAGPVLAFVSMNVGVMITETAGLSFIGLGAQPPTADWGTMLADGRQFITVAPAVAAIPGLAIFILVLGCNLVADGWREALDPRLQ